MIEQIRSLRNMTVEVRAGRAVRLYKVVKKDGPDDLVFQSVMDGQPMNDQNILKRHIQPAARELGLKVHWRALRTSYVTWNASACEDFKAVQGHARHAKPETTFGV